VPLDRELVPVLNSDPLLARNSHSIASLPPLGYSRLTEYHSTEKVLTGVTPKNLQNCRKKIIRINTFLLNMSMQEAQNVKSCSRGQHVLDLKLGLNPFFTSVVWLKTF
jgi:hypothetical protein